MEQARVEMTVVEDAVALATEAQLRQLNDLELAFVGGGYGEITPY